MPLPKGARAIQHQQEVLLSLYRHQAQPIVSISAPDLYALGSGEDGVLGYPADWIQYSVITSDDNTAMLADIANLF